SAHAVLIKSVPGQGALLHEEPRQIVLRFNEPVETSFGAVRIYDDRGKRVDRGAPLRPRSDTIGMRIGSGLLGVYTTTYRVPSALSRRWLPSPCSGSSPAACHSTICSRAPSSTRRWRLAPALHGRFGAERGSSCSRCSSSPSACGFAWLR